MAMGSPMFSLLACMLLATTMVLATPAYPPEKPHVPPVKAPVHPPKPHAHPPAHPPKKPGYHHHVPAKAPTHAPEKHHHHFHHHAHAPKIAPIHPPVKVGAPTPSMAHKGCVPMCEEYCKKDHLKKRPCMETCTVCCHKSKCVPEHKKKCSWDYVKMDGKMVKCP